MNKKEQISFLNNQLSLAEMRISLGRQIIEEATQSKVEAKRALELLRANPGRTRKGESNLPESITLRLTSGLTKQNKSA